MATVDSHLPTLPWRGGAVGLSVRALWGQLCNLWRAAVGQGSRGHQGPGWGASAGLCKAGLEQAGAAWKALGTFHGAGYGARRLDLCWGRTTLT